jgi:hypothetical protein
MRPRLPARRAVEKVRRGEASEEHERRRDGSEGLAVARGIGRPSKRTRVSVSARGASRVGTRPDEAAAPVRDGERWRYFLV